MRPRLYSLFFFLIVILSTRCLLAQSTPSITGLVPTGGPVGASVVISGTGFGATQGSSTVTFSGVAATPTAWSDTSITVSVPTGATTGYVLVTVGGLPGYGMLFAVATSNLTLTGSLSTARMFQTTTLLDTGKILIAGGVDGFGYHTISSAELYNPTTGTFASTGSLNTGRIFNTATLLNNGKVLIAGGTDSNWNNIATSELYDPVAGTFSFTGSMGTPRDSQTATLLNNGKVLMVGGVSSNGIWITGLAANSEVYDPGAGTFSPTGSLATARDCHTATLLNNGKVLIVGGNDVNGYALASAELYDPAAGTFAPTGSLNTGRAVHTASLLNNGMVLVTGGYDFYGNAVGNAELYDPATGTFTVTGSLNTPRYDGAQSVLLNNGMVLIMGGQDNYGNSLNSVELYDPTAGTFSVTGGMNSTRQSLTATLLNNGQVLIAAGMDYYANVLTSAELYQPNSLTPPGLVSIALSPQNPLLTVGGSQQLVATGTFSDNSTETLESVAWSSTATSIATVSNDASNYGNALGITTGTVTISACAGSVCGSTTLTVGSSAPSITTISPVVGVVGTPVTITGAGFGIAQGGSTVTFNGTAGTPTCWGDTSITVPVPAGASTGNVVVSVNGSTSNGVSFTLGTPAGFTPLGAMPNGRDGSTATLLNNGTVLIVGGSDSNYNPTANAAIFNPSTGVFAATASLNTGRASHTATLLNDGTVLIAGGYDNNYNSVASAEVYNPATGSFYKVGSLSYPRSNHSAASLSNGKVLIAGGVDRWGNAMGVGELYDPAQGTFTSTGTLNTARELHTTTLLDNGKVLVAGGNDGNGNVLASAELYDPTSGTFTVTGSLNVGRDPDSATLLNNGMVLVAGGLDVNYNVLASAELYDPNAGVFTLTGNMSTARQSHTATLLNNGSVLVAGGYDINGVALGSAELYDPAAGAFAVTGGLNAPRGSETATLLLSGAVLFTGGVDNNANVLSSAELYLPTSYTPPGLASISITPANQTIPASTSQQFVATGIFNDNSTQTLISATWGSSAAIATVTNDATNYGNASGLTQGTATVSACAGSICGSTGLTVTSAPVLVPGITSLSPTSGPAESTVTITGTNFGALQGNSAVTINGTPATVLAWDGIQIMVQVPQAATSGNVVVTVNGSASNGVPFTVLVPTIASLSPNIGAVGMAVTITGANFGATQGGSTVTFNGAPASISSWGASSVMAQVPNGATTGTVVVTVNGVASNGIAFTVVPTPNITSVSPTSGPAATSVTITGTNFSATQGSSTVTFNGAATTATQWSATGITVTVPTAATTGNLVVTVFGVASNGVRFTVAGAPGFTAAGDLRSARWGDSATLLGSGLVLLAGGWDNNGSLLATAELYDPAAGVSYLTGDLNIARDSHTATLLNDGTVLIVGGTNQNGITQATAEIYDPATGSFTSTGNLNTPRYNHTATVLNNGTVLIAGGLDRWGNILASAEIYDPAAGTFTQTGSLNTARKLHTAALLNNGMVLVVGGTSGWGSDATLASAELYDPANGTFSNTGSLLTARQSATQTLLNGGAVLIAGGWGTNGTALSSVELYNPTTGTFAATGNLGTGRGSHTATLLNNGTVLITGGWDINYNTLDSAELYDPAAGTFAPTGSLNTARGLATATLAGNGTVLVAGGMDQNGTALASAELYQPGTLTPAGLVSIALSPLSSSISANVSQQFTATGTFSDNSTQTLASAAWSSSAGSIATLTNDAGNHGNAFGVAQGAATVQACTGTICGSTSITVGSATSALPQIDGLAPGSGAVGSWVAISGSNFGATQGSSTVTFRSTAATIVSWSDTAILVTVPNNLPANQTVPVVVTTSLGASQPADFIPVSASTPTPYRVSPQLVNLLVGQTRTVTVTDGSGNALSGLEWTTSNSNVASLSTDDPPVITAVAPGTAVVYVVGMPILVTVYSGSSLPAGTPIWSFPIRTSSGIWPVSMAPAVPSSSGVDLFVADADAGTLYALGSDGSLIWKSGWIGVSGPLAVGSGGSLSPAEVIPVFSGNAFVKAPTFGFANNVNYDTHTLSWATQGASPKQIYTFSHPSCSGGLCTDLGSTQVVIPHPSGPVFIQDNSIVTLIDPVAGQQLASVMAGNSTAMIVAGDGNAYLPYIDSTGSSQTYGSGPFPATTTSVTNLKLLRFSPDGTNTTISLGSWSSEVDCVNWTPTGIDPGDVIEGIHCTGSGSNTSLDRNQSVITNADTGAAVFSTLSSPCADAYYAEYYVTDSNGQHIQTYGPQDTGCPDNNLQLTLVASDTVTGQFNGVLSWNPSGTSPAGQGFVPSLQREDGSFIGGDVNGNLIAIGATGSVVWQQQVSTPDPVTNVPPPVYPLYATADGGVIATSTCQSHVSQVLEAPWCGTTPLLGTTYTIDQDGNVTAQTADTGAFYSWTNQWYADPLGEVHEASGNPVIMAGWGLRNLSLNRAATNNPWFPPLPSCQSNSSVACPGAAEVANSAFTELKRLVANDNNCPLCLQWVFAKLPGGAADGGSAVRQSFSNWLNKSAYHSFWNYQVPGLIDGTISKAPNWWLCSEGSLISCFIHNPLPKVAAILAATAASNVSKAPSHEGFVSFYNTKTYWGKAAECYETLSTPTTGMAEKSITFHEALHGFTGLFDPDLANALGLVDPDGHPYPDNGSEDAFASNAITNYIAQHVFGLPEGLGVRCGAD